MGWHIDPRELLCAVEGVALFRGMFGGTDEEAQQRLDELRRILEAPAGAAIDVTTVEVGEGYARWSTTYDDPGNPLVATEQPAVWELLDESAPGRALDAACGTGRHARRLTERGHTVTGVDQSAEMLARAREAVPAGRFLQGDLHDLPLDEDSFDLAVCALALEHIDELEPPIGELARVVRPGGRVVISESHPALRALGGAPYFRDAAGASGVVRAHPYLHADYLDAFAATGLTLRRCHEVRFGPVAVAMQPTAFTHPEATDAALLGFPAALIWDLTVAE